jgi:hypothetical protein
MGFPDGNYGTTDYTNGKYRERTGISTGSRELGRRDRGESRILILQRRSHTTTHKPTQTLRRAASGCSAA